MKTRLTLIEWQDASIAQRHEWLCEDRRLDALSTMILHQQIVWGASDAKAREVYQQALSGYRASPGQTPERRSAA